MELRYIRSNSELTIAELTDEHYIISQPQQVLDIFGDLMATDCERLVIHERNLHPDFFDLKTRLAGEVLQKFSNYRVQIAIVGDYTKYNSRSLQDFIFESNKSKFVFFTDNINSALDRLKKIT